MKNVCALLLVAVILVAVVAFPALAQDKTAMAAESEVRTTLAAFILAFNNLDWERFRIAFADDATVFYPRAFPHRADGRAEFEQTFRHVFEEIRAGKTKGPYMDLQPVDLKIQITGDVAIATFHLDDRLGSLNRRTIVLQKRANGWKIIHLHASEVRLASN
jgi:ketosteroid isomerase-like protein